MFSCGSDLTYLANIWVIRLFDRHCDISKDFRVEIRAIHSRTHNYLALSVDHIFCGSPKKKKRGFETTIHPFVRVIRI